MKISHAAMTALMTLAAALCAGCGLGSGNVQAVAPAPQDRMSSIASESGPFNLYRAVGTDQDSSPVVEKIWTVSVSRGERVGFHWRTDKVQEWAPAGGLHLIAYAGGQTRDLGGFDSRDTKYVWAGNTDDVLGYFHGRSAEQSIGIDQ